MQYPCLKKGAVQEYKLEWQALRYRVGEKMFALLGKDNMGRDIISLKLTPAEGQLLRAQFADIIPGYYLNKEYWNSVCLNGSVPEDVLKKMIYKSYTLVFSSLTKKRQKEIEGIEGIAKAL